MKTIEEIKALTVKALENSGNVEIADMKFYGVLDLGDGYITVSIYGIGDTITRIDKIIETFSNSIKSQVIASTLWTSEELVLVLTFEN